MGLSSQLGVAVESNYGTYVAPTRFIEFVSESLSRSNRTIQSEGLRGAGRQLRRGSRRNLVGRSAAGSLNLEVGPDGFGLLFEHALGAVATSTPVGATLAREHLFTLGALNGKSLTVQKGVEADDGTVIPFSYLGCKVGQWNLSTQVDGFVLLNLDLDAQDESTAQSLAVATYSEGSLFSFEGCSVTVEGAPVAAATSIEITAQNPMATEKYYLGNAGLKGEPTDEGYPTVSGTMRVRFTDLSAYYAAFQADSAVAIVFNAVTGDEVEAGFAEQLTVTLPDVRFDGDTPQVSGPSIPEVTIPFTAMAPVGGGEPITVLLRNGDAAP